MGEDCEIAVAHNGQEVLDIAFSSCPDVILLDVMMPDINGFKVCERLKADPRTKETPVIFLTAKTEVDDVVEGLGRGAVDYVKKPFNANELVTRIRTQLEIKEKNQRLREHNALVERQSEQLQTLIHVLFHDLANPLSSIHQFLGVAEEDPALLDRETVRELHQVSGQGIELIKMVRSLCLLEEGKFKLDLEAMDLEVAVREAEMVLSNRFQEKRVALAVDIPPDLLVMVERGSFVSSVLSNALTNAIKFSERNSMIQVAGMPAGPGKVELTVRDRGVGIPGPLLQVIFDIGVTKTRPGTEGEVGTGYGMELMRKFVEAYGGGIQVESKDVATHPRDHGTTVRITLNRA